jgi:predicted phage terminase large subunit-like protein
MALVAETAADARDVMVQSSGGILRCHPPEFRPTYKPSLRKLEWPNGAVAHTYSADDPEQLRGPEHEAAWSDELAKWRYAQDTWDMLQFGLRIGDQPKQLVTTTPRPIPVVRELLNSKDTFVTRGSTYDNFENLSPNFLAKMREKYEGTRLGRQELHAEVLDDVPGALWTRKMLETRSAYNPTGAGMHKDEDLPDMRRVVIGVDPSGTSGEVDMRRKENRGGDHEDEVGDDVGIVAAGLGDDGVVYILDDATVNWGPADWARRVVDTYKKHEGDMIVGEANFGGAMVEYTIRTIDKRVPYRPVHASRGKVVRAEPVAALYEQGRVRHCGSLSKLEDQMINMTQRGYEGTGSPDRLDALVWAVTDLVFGKSARGGTIALQGGHH